MIGGIRLENPIPFYRTFSTFFNTGIQSHTIARQNRGTKGGSFLYYRYFYRHTQYISQDLRPQGTLGGAACEDHFGGHISGGFFYQLHMTFYQHGGIFQNCPVEGITVKFCRIKFKIGKGGCRMLPLDKIHNITESAHHAVAAGRNFFCFFIHNIVDVFTGTLADFLFHLAEAVTEPAHDQTRFKGQGFILPDTGNRMTVDPDAAAGICGTAVSIEFILPEASAKHCSLVWFCGTYADGAELAVTAAYDNRSAYCQSGVGCSLFIYFGYNGSAFHDRREDIIPQPAFLCDGSIPFSASQIKDTCSGSIAGLHCLHAGQLFDQPVVEHTYRCDFFINLGHLILYPEKTGQGTQSIGLSALQVDFFFQFRIHADQFSHFVITSGVHIGAGPDLLTVFIVQNDSFPHAGGGDSQDLFRLDTGLLKYTIGAGTGQFPVVYPVKIHTAGITGIFPVLPLPLFAAYLVSVGIKQNSPDTAGTGIDCH